MDVSATMASILPFLTETRSTLPIFSAYHTHRVTLRWSTRDSAKENERQAENNVDHLHFELAIFATWNEDEHWWSRLSRSNYFTLLMTRPGMKWKQEHNENCFISSDILYRQQNSRRGNVTLVVSVCRNRTIQAKILWWGYKTTKRQV